jgi:hypothetical protein
MLNILESLDLLVAMLAYIDGKVTTLVGTGREGNSPTSADDNEIGLFHLVQHSTKSLGAK